MDRGFHEEFQRRESVEFNEKSVSSEGSTGGIEEEEKTNRVLGNEGQRGSKILNTNLCDIDPVDEDTSRARVGEAKKSLRQGEESA